MSEKEAGPPPLQIKYRHLLDLVPYARNARKHPPSQKSVLRASLTEYGWTSPMLIADDGMLAGHGRLEVALELAREGVAIPGNPDPWMGPTIDLSHLSEPQRRAYIIMDNRSASGSAWDEDMLVMELGALSVEDGIDLVLTGFSEKDLERLLGEADLPPLPEDNPSAKAAVQSCPECGHTWLPDRE